MSKLKRERWLSRDSKGDDVNDLFIWGRKPKKEKGIFQPAEGFKSYAWVDFVSVELLKRQFLFFLKPGQIKKVRLVEVR